jgi:hypothetical protein
MVPAIGAVESGRRIHKLCSSGCVGCEYGSTGRLVLAATAMLLR